MVGKTKELMDAVVTGDIGSVRMHVSLGTESTVVMRYVAYGLGSVAIVKLLVRYTVKYGTGDSLEYLTACGASTLNDYDYLRELARSRGEAGILDFLTANTHTKRSYLNHLWYIFNSWFGK